MADTIDATRVFSLTGLGRWLRLCDEHIAERKRPLPEVLDARARIVAELRRRGVEGVA